MPEKWKTSKNIRVKSKRKTVTKVTVIFLFSLFLHVCVARATDEFS